MPQAQWPMWVYRGTEARLLAEGDEIPAGWQDRPGIHPLDHDGDGKKGGSKRRSKS